MRLLILSDRLIKTLIMFLTIAYCGFTPVHLRIRSREGFLHSFRQTAMHFILLKTVGNLHYPIVDVGVHFHFKTQ